MSVTKSEVSTRTFRLEIDKDTTLSEILTSLISVSDSRPLVRWEEGIRATKLKEIHPKETLVLIFEDKI